MVRVFVKKQIRENLLDLEKTKYFRFMITAKLYKLFKEKKDHSYEVEIDE